MSAGGIEPEVRHEPEPPSPRGTGLVLGAACAVAAWTWRDGPAMWPLLALAGGLSLAALLQPALLEPLNRAWFRLSLLLGRIMTPLVMALLFYGLITPVALLLRLKGDDPLRLRRTGRERTWWREREGDPGDMRRQF